MRETLIRQVLWREHDEEDNEQKSIACEMRVVFFPLNSSAEESPGLSEEEEKTCEKKRPDDRIEDGVGCVIVTEILVADEIILDEGESECFSEGSEEVAMIYFGRKNRDVFGSVGEMMRVHGEIVEHGTRDDERGENECECMLPIALEEIFV